MPHRATKGTPSLALYVLVSHSDWQGNAAISQVETGLLCQVSKTLALNAIESLSKANDLADMDTCGGYSTLAQYRITVEPLDTVPETPKKVPTKPVLAGNKPVLDTLHSGDFTAISLPGN